MCQPYCSVKDTINGDTCCKDGLKNCVSSAGKEYATLGATASDGSPGAAGALASPGAQGKAGGVGYFPGMLTPRESWPLSYQMIVKRCCHLLCRNAGQDLSKAVDAGAHDHAAQGRTGMGGLQRGRVKPCAGVGSQAGQPASGPVSPCCRCNTCWLRKGRKVVGRQQSWSGW